MVFRHPSPAVQSESALKRYGIDSIFFRYPKNRSFLMPIHQAFAVICGEVNVRLDDVPRNAITLFHRWVSPRALRSADIIALRISYFIIKDTHLFSFP